MAMYLESFKQYIMNLFKKDQRQEERVSKFEAYICVLYKFLIWDDPALSTFVLIAFHMLFWVIVQFQLRFYTVLFLSLLIALIIDASFENYIMKQTETDAPLKGIRNTIQHGKQIFIYLVNLRKEHPGTFCIIMCSCFVTLSIIGRAISGLCLIYLTFLSIILIPGLLKNLPPQLTEPLKQIFVLISSNEGVVEENELLPTGQEEIIDDGESTRTDLTAESVGNSFISGVTTMPSYLEAEGSIDGLEEEDLELPRNLRGITPSNLSDSSDSEHRDIKFETKHFNGDSSSEDDINYEKGLTFTEVDITDQSSQQLPRPSLTQQLGADLLSNIGAMGSSIVSSVLGTTTTTAPVRRSVKKSDSDSDFEIINNEDEFPSSET